MPLYSHSRLSTFEQCSLKYKYRYIDRLEPDIKNTIEGFLGSKVHDCLEWIYNQAIKGRTIDLDSIIEKYASSWKKDYSQDIKVVKEELSAEDYFNKGIKFLIDYYKSHQPFIDDTIELEKKIIFSLDPQGKYKIIGFIDRLVHNKETNIFEIHDYKTSGTLKSQEDLDKDRQLALYSLAIRKLFSNVSDVKLIWHYLDFNQKLTSERTIDQLEILRQEIINLINKIESTNEFTPNPGILCKWCEFRSYCPIIKKQEQRDKDLTMFNTKPIKEYQSSLVLD